MVGCVEFARKLAQQHANKKINSQTPADKALARTKQAQSENNLDDPWQWLQQLEQQKKDR